MTNRGDVTLRERTTWLLCYQDGTFIEAPKLALILATDPGRVLGDQTDGLLEFSRNVMVLIRSPVIFKSLEKMKMAVLKGETNGITLEDLMNIDIQGLLFRLAQEGPIQEEVPEEAIVDPLWFASLVALAFYAYLENYASALVDLISNSEDLVNRIESHLVKMASLQKRRSRPPIVTFEGLGQMGVRAKLRTITDALSLEEDLLKVLDKEKLEMYKKAFEQYIKIRGKIAHSSPRLSAEEYTLQEFDFDLGTFDPRVLPPILEDTTMFKEGVLEFSRGIFAITKSFIRIEAVVKMAIMYPGLLDCALSAHIGLDQIDSTGSEKLME